MSRKIGLNGIVVSVQEEDFEEAWKMLKLMESDGVEVRDLQGTETNEPYDFNELIEKANEYSNKDPPDVVEFSEKAWGAALLCVKEFFLKHCRVLIKSSSAKIKLLDLIRDFGLSNLQSIEVGNAWAEVKNSRSRFYDIVKLMVKEAREALLESIKGMAATIEQAGLNKELICTELNSLTSVNIASAHEETCKIGKCSYSYDRIAY